MASPNYEWTRRTGWTALPSLSISTAPGTPWDVNASGDIVGETWFAYDEFSTFQRGYSIPAHKSIVDLGDQFVPLGINRDGVMAGYTGLGYAEPNAPAVRLTGGAVVYPTAPGGVFFGRAFDVNTGGDVVGMAVVGETDQLSALVWLQDPAGTPAAATAAIGSRATRPSLSRGQTTTPTLNPRSCAVTEVATGRTECRTGH